MAELHEQIRESLRCVIDPELHFSVVDLGLIYNIVVDEAGEVIITMTFTSPMCPAQDQLKKELVEAAKKVPGVTSVVIDLTFQPIWSGQMATPELQQQFVLMGIPLTRF